ncbi:DUF6226 family protein [Rhodococcus opacus]|uniref:Uncharacterized protein n=1 Tax=Rhodococcus opacus RKJ300 = JCM 13270 TaxID=1165867 RepID=I0WM62_RHOOP|nr:hypothetical protein W59_23500 [Rhodococcus opacus RKJ300 = JCM 13270]
MVEDPPAEAYGRVTNPERFAPLLPAAEDLIADLERRFDVSVARGPAPPSESATVELVELVEITPIRVDQAPLAITFTSFPGLYLDAGAWAHIALPACGCDACDESAEDVLRELAEYSEALTAGQLSERITGRFRPILEHSWDGEGWVRSGTRRDCPRHRPLSCVPDRCSRRQMGAGGRGPSDPEHAVAAPTPVADP